LARLLLDLTDSALAATTARPGGGAVRLWVDRAFTIRGTGTVVTGTLPAGTVRTGQGLLLEYLDRRRVTERLPGGLHRLRLRKTGVITLVAALPLGGGEVKGPGEGEAGEQADDEVQPRTGDPSPTAISNCHQR